MLQKKIFFAIFLFTVTLIIFTSNFYKNQTGISLLNRTMDHTQLFSLIVGKKIEIRVNISLVLSYSIFGKDSARKWGYLIGMVAKEAKKSNLYHDWTVRIYHDKSLSKEYIKNHTSKFDNLKFYDVSRTSLYGDITSINGRVWRFLPLADDTVDIVCIRDLDSPIIKREEDAVNEWLKSGHIMHVMRDHYWHTTEILAGLWGFRSAMDRTLAHKIVNLVLLNAERRTENHEATKLNDQIVLAGHIWPLVKPYTLQHDSYLCTRYIDTVPFPTKRYDDFLFVGCIRPCNVTERVPCDVKCRPTDHKDWTYC
ncbi:uncharacterized protein LOC130623556 [Hydractinia symbiolongicarpus]|uniref:uncharacterized protein LOC130623556 n=1 Tax=Hydractinia symbiolongicarpus TaxID=13093 RepID=UPI00254B83D6|nr:uncharacterized protein LOC130623556 [Hydractinia symbiolongicarpus]XP_057295033.1 uncharacterized protein LOC130623556 [Hydractinia symbiolongicarpus]XP_057295034.1 uncharacterized protein LOC130623556 [Hydractinia symbiolongicarpus]